MLKIIPLVTLSLALLAVGLLWPSGIGSVAPSNSTVPSPAAANCLLQQQPGFFVPNLGQWEHPAGFVHRSGPMTLFVEDRGWVLNLVERPREDPADRTPPWADQPLDLQKAMQGDDKKSQKLRGVALQMTFEGDAYVPEIVGEEKFAGHHNYFLGNDESRWRTGVPLYASVRYENLYPGIDLRLREMNGVPEYDLLLQPGADLSRVTVHVEGGQGLSIASDGSLVIETALGPLTQSVPKTWQVGHGGNKREVVCNFTLLGAERFGFEAPGWDGDTSLTIDPGLIWSTYLGGGSSEYAYGVCVDARGVVTVAGNTASANFPTTSGAYDTTFNGSIYDGDAFVSRLDPSKTGTAQLVYSTYLGGSGYDMAIALHVDARGVVTLAGRAQDTFPVTSGAYDTTYNGGSNFEGDVFVSRLDPKKTGSAQLVYSTFLGGNDWDFANALSVDSSGVVTVGGAALSTNFPTTSGAYAGGGSAFVSRLDPSKIGTAQLVYSTLFGGRSQSESCALAVEGNGVVTVAGYTLVQTGNNNFPTTPGAYDTTYNGGADAFVSRLDPIKSGSAQLIYSTFLGGNDSDVANALWVDASGVVTVAGRTSSTNFPTTGGSYDTTYNGGKSDVFVSRLIPAIKGTVGLVYSTFLGGGSSWEEANALFVDPSGVVTVAGYAGSTDFPTTSDAYDTTHNGSHDAFVSRLDSSKTGSTQLVYSTYLGGSSWDRAYALSVDACGVVTVAGETASANFPPTIGAYDTTFNGAADAFVSRLDMGVAFYADRYELSLKQPGTQQKLTLNAGKIHAGKLYWIFGSFTGTSPGVTLGGVHIPLNPDAYTDLTIGVPGLNPPFLGFRGTLDAAGTGSASFVIPSGLPALAGITLRHAYLVTDAQGVWHMASNPVPLMLRN